MPLSKEDLESLNKIKLPNDINGWGIAPATILYKEYRVFDRIRQWASDRNLIQGATTHAQMLKLTEEVGELASAIAKNKQTEIYDAIGDCVVVLTILAAQNGMVIEGAVINAYETIKDRKGKMVNGVFVKESDLK